MKIVGGRHAAKPIDRSVSDLQAIVVGIRRDRRAYVPDFDDVIQPVMKLSGHRQHDTERTLKIFGMKNAKRAVSR